MAYKTWLQQFHEAIKDGTVEEAKQILREKPADNSIDSRGTTCLEGISALEYLTSKKPNSRRDVDMIIFLVRSGANPLKRTANQHSTPAAKAFSNHGNYVVKELLDHVKNLNVPLDTIRMHNALHISACHRNKDIMEYCLDHKVNVNQPTLYGMTALTLAIKYKELVNLLLKKGANVNVRMINGFTPIHVDLSLNRKYDVLNMLLACEPDLNARCLTGDTPLHTALKINPNVNLIKKLIKHGSLSYIPGRNGGNSLHILVAANPNHSSVLRVADILIENGACVNSRDHNGETPVHLAIRQKAYKLVEYLALRGADLSLKNNLQQLPTHNIQEYESDTKLLTVIIRHITMETHKKRINLPPEYENSIESSQKMKKIRDKCKEEIERMEKSNIPNTNMTYLKLFSLERRRVAKFARVKKSKIFLQKFQAKLFLNYGRQLKNRINGGICRRQLEDHALSYLRKVFDKRIPMYCLEQLLDFLSDSDLCNLRTCLSVANSSSAARDFLNSITA